jgi:hypothetical protein
MRARKQAKKEKSLGEVLSTKNTFDVGLKALFCALGSRFHVQ